MKKQRLVLFGIIIILLTACAKNNFISVLQHTMFTKINLTQYSVIKKNEARLHNKLERHGYYKVIKGDTLYRIALNFKQNYNNIAIWNNLNNPNDIKINQMIRVVSPISHLVEVTPVNIIFSDIEEIKFMNNVLDNDNTKKRYIIDKNTDVFKKNNQFYSGNKIIHKIPLESKQNITTVTSDKKTINWIWPTKGKIISQFNDIKKGINIAGKVGQPIVAASSGKVMYAGSGIRGYGNLVIVKHTNDFLSAYAHNKSILVKEGQIVTIGTKIAEMGNSDSDNVKLHFEIRQEGKPVDPFKFLPLYKIKHT